jgi:hypothetical protein
MTKGAGNVATLSLAQKLEKLHSLLESEEGEKLSEWEWNFIEDNHAKLERHNGATSIFTGKVCEKIDELYERRC